MAGEEVLELAEQAAHLLAALPVRLGAQAREQARVLEDEGWIVRKALIIYKTSILDRSKAL